MKNCQNCQKIFVPAKNDDNPLCGSCRGTQVWGQPPFDQPQPKTNIKKVNKKIRTVTLVGISGLVLATLLSGSGLSGSGSTDINSDDKSKRTMSKVSARVECELAVESRLKAPRTAKFSNVVAVYDGSWWNVVGYVDAQNGFGAMIRSSFACIVNDGGQPSVMIN